jgi:phage tail sheath protein FI
MPSYKRPGVYTSENLIPVSTQRAAGTTDTVFLGAHHRGPTDAPVYVTSWGQFAASFGGFPTTGTATELPYALYNYFANGGRGAWVCRVLGTGSGVATVTLDDRNAGTAAATLTVTAKNAGAWGNNIRVSIVDRDATNGRFDLIVYSGGTTDTYIVERWTDLSMVDSDSRYVESIINSASAGSAYIAVSDLDSATAAPLNMPAVQAGTALTGGLDGAAPTTAEKTTAVEAGTSLLDQIEGLATVNFPGETTAGVINALINYASNRGDLFVVVDPVSTATPGDVVTYTAGLTPTSSYAAVYYPWVITQDPNSTTPGATRLCPPGPLVAGKYAETDTSRGVFKAPAGLQTTLNGVVALGTKLTNANLDTLNEAHVNVLKQLPGAGVAVMGARTLKKTTSDKYVNVRRTLNYIKRSLVVNTEFAVFENNDSNLWSQLTSQAERFLSSLHQAGGLKGGTPEEAFYVKCDEELNTAAVISSGEVRMEIGVALQHPAEFVVIRIGQWEGGQNATDAA